MLNPENWSLFQGLAVFGLCALVIAIAGTRITRIVDQLADRTGIGEAAAGAVLSVVTRLIPYLPLHRILPTATDRFITP
ncbi:hypothetical protein [Idiomarina sp. ST10R2A5]|uniref:hypothetical protein n=1 Tax=Idiomarina sp. ST10R2A5 TaxID=3418368 RepID=UPI003EC6CEFC